MNPYHLLIFMTAYLSGLPPAELESRAVVALQVRVPALQEAYRVRHGRYAADLRELTGGADTLASGVRVIIHSADEDGWAASSSFATVPGPACAAWVGNPPSRPMLRGNVGPRRAAEVMCIAFEPLLRRGVIERSGPYLIDR